MADTNDTFMRELKQEIERERFERLWKQYSGLIVGGATAIILLVAGTQLWQWRQSEQAEAAGARYEQALQLVREKKLDEAAKGFAELGAAEQAGYSALAQLQLAATKLEADKRDEALAAFDDLARRGSADPLIRDFAAFQAAALRLKDADFTEMENRLNDLTKEGNAWRFSARELLALAQIKAGKTDKARESLELILADVNAPPGLQDRARLMMAQIVAQDIKAEAAAERKSEAAEPASPGGGATPQPAEGPAATAAQPEPAAKSD